MTLRTGTGCLGVSMPSRAWVVTTEVWPNSPKMQVSMPSRAWVVTRDAVDSFKCSRVSMPSRAWVVTIKGLISADLEKSFNALTGLSCYKHQNCQRFHTSCFNALTGLSCYTINGGKRLSETSFQCPHGLELLLNWNIILWGCLDVSMPSRAWVVTSDDWY